MAVVPMPLAPPCTSTLSPGLSSARRNRFSHTVKECFGQHGRLLNGQSRRDRQALHGRRHGVLGVTPAAEQGTHQVADMPVTHGAAERDDFAGDLEPGNR